MISQFGTSSRPEGRCGTLALHQSLSPRIGADIVFHSFGEWAKKHGNVFTLKIGPTNAVVLHDRRAIHKVLVERGAQHSGRKKSYLANIITRGDNISLVDDHKMWREKRKILSHHVSPKALDERHYKVQEAE